MIQRELLCQARTVNISKTLGGKSIGANSVITIGSSKPSPCRQEWVLQANFAGRFVLRCRDIPAGSRVHQSEVSGSDIGGQRDEGAGV